MKNLFLLIVILVLTVNFTIATETFGRVYRQHGNIYSVEETQDGGFILGSDKGIIKTNSDGRIEWQQFVDAAAYKRTGAVQSNDGTYLLAFVKEENEQYFLHLNKYASNGNLLLSKVLLEVKKFISIKKTLKGGYALILEITDYFTLHYLLKVKPDLEQEWHSSFASLPSFRSDPHFIQTFDSSFLAIGTRGKLTKFNSQGDTVWTNYEMSTRYYLVAELSDRTIILGGNDRIGFFNNIGELLNEKIIEASYPQGMVIDEANSSIFLAGESLLKFDFNFETIWQVNSKHDSKDIIFSAGQKLISVGKHEAGGFLLKTDFDGNYDYLALSEPIDKQVLRVSDRIEIAWATTFSENIDLSFSMDNGQTWETIVSDYPADSLKYNWTTPGIQTNELLIRIELSSDEQWYDQHDFPITVVRKDYDYIAINESKMWFNNSGRGSQRPNLWPGFFWPGGEQAASSFVYSDGFLWGGLIQGDTVCNGTYFGSGLQPGNILEDGKPSNPEEPVFGIWKVRKKWESFPEGQMKDRLQYDWENWPVHLGAPWIDNNFDGVYDPEIDEPDIEGDELNWMVMNDLDPNKTNFDSKPIGLEIKLSIYGYAEESDLKDVIFKKYQINNKSKSVIQKMFLAYWSEANFQASVVGSDSVLNLGYSYNSFNEMDGTIAPAIGYLLLSGVKIAMDTSHLGLTSFTLMNDDLYCYWNPQGPFRGLSKTQQMYNYFGAINNCQERFFNPITNELTNYVLSGNPVNKTGWYEGEGWPGGPHWGGGRQLLLSSGPFDFAPGDSQEVVYAIIMARGKDHLDSITELKRKAAAVREFYYTGVLPTAIEDEVAKNIPQKYSLSQNYPNPFNPTTTINYQLQTKSDVKLIVYDVLGRRVKTLIDKRQNAGLHKVTFDASSLASGIYYYKLKAGPSTGVRLSSAEGSGQVFEKTNKMLLLR